MIIESIINILFIPISAILELLPDFSWTIQIATGSILAQLFAVTCYILPINTIVTILSLVILITIIRIVISVIKLVLNLLPFF